MRAAYLGLPDDIKGRIENLVAEHWIWHSRKLAAPQEFNKPTDEEKATLPPAYHKLVQVAPDGMNRTLYIASHARRIIGITDRESTSLIKALLDHAQQPQYQITVKWKNVGDLVQWDNRCTMHRATAFQDQKNRRDMRRTTTHDHGPAAFGVKNQLSADYIDIQVGGKIDISTGPTPETQTQEQILRM
jgi:alpha-ketoglutarate-dependent 2,4-dichlorophenoxyacetate dioxygenase